jgi:hypothetical protein
MTSRNGVLGLMVLLVVIILGFKNYEIWSASGLPRSSKSDVRKAGVKLEPLPAFLPARERASAAPYLAIAEKNIFSPDRKDFAAQMSEGSAPLSRPQVVLYGVVIGDQFQTASVVSRGRVLLKGERELKTLKLGDQIGGYKLTKIFPDRITLEAAGDSFEVLLFDPKSPKRHVDVRTTSPPPATSSRLAVPPSRSGPTAPVARGTVSSQTAPKPMGSVPQRAVQVPPPRPTPQGGVPDPGIWRGRKP